MSKYFKFPLGHPKIHVGDACREKQVMLRMEGLIKCTVIPTRRLYHPVLPFRCNNKLLFCLCKRVLSSEIFRENACTNPWRGGL